MDMRNFFFHAVDVFILYVCTKSHNVESVLAAVNFSGNVRNVELSFSGQYENISHKRQAPVHVNQK